MQRASCWCKSTLAGHLLRTLRHLPLFMLILPGLLPMLAQPIITTVAGSGRVFQGNGGPATSAGLGNIEGLAIDAAGNIYAADDVNQIVVRISPVGVLTVVAGTGSPGFTGDGGPAANAALNHPIALALDGLGNLYIADRLNFRVREVSVSGFISTVAGNGELGS